MRRLLVLALLVAADKALDEAMQGKDYLGSHYTVWEDFRKALTARLKLNCTQ